MNQMISTVMSAATLTLRYPGYMNNELVRPHHAAHPTRLKLPER